MQLGTSEEKGRLAKEIAYARYLVNDEDVLYMAPKEFVEKLLAAAAMWLALNNPHVKVLAPDFIQSTCLGISTYTEISVLDLIKWARVGMMRCHDTQEYLVIRQKKP